MTASTLRAWRTLPLLCLFVLSFITTAASAQPNVPPCSSPRAAARSLFYWLQAEHFDPYRATLCFETGGKRQDQLVKAARHAKAVFDSRALRVHLDELSDHANWLEEASGAG